MVEEDHRILTFKNDWMFSLLHFQFKSINISTILTSKLKHVCIFGDLFLGYDLEFLFLEWNLV